MSDTGGRNQMNDPKVYHPIELPLDVFDRDNHPIELPLTPVELSWLPIKMSADIFERKYADEITWQTEVLLGDVKDGSEDGIYSESEYDQAYEEAIRMVAKDKDIELI